MDGKGFDSIARSLGSGASRRSVVKGLAAGLGGGLMAVLGRRTGAQAQDVIDCDDLGLCPDGLVCLPNEGAGICVACVTNIDCAAGSTCNAENVCVDLCNNACADDETCRGGWCVPTDPCRDITCADDEYCSAGWCLPTDPCRDIVCEEGQHCAGGWCVWDDPCTPIECPDDEYCSGGWCVPTDPCRDITCPDDEYCVNGYCTPIDPCRDITCADDEYCINGYCAPVDPCRDIVCEEGQHCAEGWCIDNECEVDADCGDGKVCVEFMCAPECEADPDCPEGQICSEAGACVDPPAPPKPQPGKPAGGHADEVKQVTTLPETGTGDSANSNASWLGAAALGGAAAAFIAGKRMREESRES